MFFYVVLCNVLLYFVVLIFFAKCSLSTLSKFFSDLLCLIILSLFVKYLLCTLRLPKILKQSNLTQLNFKALIKLITQRRQWLITFYPECIALSKQPCTDLFITSDVCIYQFGQCGQQIDWS